jgi:hypothetical protein
VTEQIIERYRTKLQALSGNEFVASLLSLCDEFADKLSILTFGFIIFDETTPEYRKILRDKDYWEALDNASGNKMIIFAISDQRKKVERLPIEHSRSTSHWIMGVNPSKITGPKKLTKSYSHLLNTVFKSESLLVYPSVLFFQVEDGKIYDYRLVPLKRGDIWESMNEVQKLFESIAKVLDRIRPKYYENRHEIFQLVKEELLNQKYTMYILRGPKLLSDFIGMVKNFLFFS